MLKLIKLEWSKFRKNNTITLLFIFFLMFMPLALYVAKYFNDLNEMAAKFLGGGILSSPAIWSYLGYAGNWVVFFFLGVLIIYTVTIDVSTKTMRQNIIGGLSRKVYILGKFQNVILMSVFATLYYALLCVIIGSIYTENASLSKLMDNQCAIGRFFLMSLAYLNFALMLAMWFRKAGMAVFTYIAYIIGVETLLKILTKKYIVDSSIVNYFPMNAAEDLMPIPKFGELADSMTESDLFLSYPQASIATIIYLIIFAATTYFFFHKRDL